MKELVAIALWAALFTGPLTQPGQIFGWLKALIYRYVKSEALYNALAGCAKCHAGQVAFWFQIYQMARWGLPFDFAFVVFSIALAMCIEKLIPIIHD